ncbi:GNAT family N-acetyltransferase [Micropruina sp.]|uniref:GNAT family N-acetyltransferase n=1 Tax=Micropruina sp. TaxID=2737536 RepID=UPI0039E408C5
MNEPEVRLRPLRAGDAADVLAAFTSAADMAPQGDVTSLAAATAYVRRLRERHHLAFGVIFGDHVVGAVGITVDHANRNGWLWYWLHADYRGRGWASRATATVADWALTDGGLQRLELGHRVNNPASGRVAQAAGFVCEGLQRRKLLLNGERIDVLSYGRLSDDPWPAYQPLPLSLPL